jgi:hypothetical protein
MDNNIFEEKFSTGQIVKATGVSNAALQTWLKRGIIVGHRNADIEGGGSPGLHRRYSFFNLMEIATAKAIIDCGVSDLALAFQAARAFAHVGSGPLPGEAPERQPGMPFYDHRTLLCVGQSGGTYVAFWKSGNDPLANIRMALGRPAGFLVIDINDLFDRVVAVLGYHPQAVLDFAYSANKTSD